VAINKWLPGREVGGWPVQATPTMTNEPSGADALTGWPRSSGQAAATL